MLDDATPAPPSEDLVSSVHSRRISRSSTRPVSVNPVGVLGQARNLDEALLLTLSTAVAAVSAQAGLLHRYNDSLSTAITACVQGPGSEQLLGNRLAPTDPTLDAARAGITIIAEPSVGAAGRQMAARFTRAGLLPVGVAMVPIRLFDRLLALIEVAQVSRAFTAREIARIEDVADVLTERLVVNGWFELPA